MLYIFPKHTLPTLALCVLLLTVATPAKAQTQTPMPTPTPTPALTEDQKAKVTKAQEAVRAANSAFENVELARRVAAGRASQLVRLTAFETADENSLRNFDELTGVVKRVSENSFLKAGDENPYLADLKKAKTERATACGVLPTGDNQPDQIAKARGDCEAAATRLDTEEKSVNATRDELLVALNKVYDSGKRFVKLMDERLSRIGSIGGAEVAGETKQDRLVRTLPRQLPVFTQLERLRRDFRADWKALKEALAAVPGNTHTGEATSVDDALAALDTKINATLVKLDDWFITLKAKADSEARTLSGTGLDVRTDPVAKSSAAYSAAQSGSELIGKLKQVFNAWIELSAQLPDLSELPPDGVPTFDLEKTARSAQAMDTTTRSLNFAVTDVNDAVTGDFKDFEADQVSLFYFTDVPRLMQILNPATYEVGGLRDAGERAANERRKLSTTELALADAQGEANSAQQRVIELREQLRQSQAASDSVKGLFRSSTLNVNEAQRDFDRATELHNKAKTAADAAPDDPGKRAALDRAAQNRDHDEARLREARERNEEVDEEKKAADEQATKLRDEQNGLPKKIQEAESRLSAAQGAVNLQRKNALLAAQAESEAFVRARDNRPYWYAPATGSSTDPAKRVLMWAFNDSKTIFLRGKKRDLDSVRAIIAEVDRPAPQARMTLWTMELSSKASESGAKRFNRGLEMVNNHLSGARAYIAAAHSLLRDCINDQVSRVTEIGGANDGMQNANDYYLARINFYHPEVLLRLKLDPAKMKKRLANQELRKSAEIDLRIAQWVIPDPAGTTTLGEALMVLSLGKREHRTEIMRRFTAELPTYLKNLGLKDAPKIEETTIWFAELKRALGLDASAEPRTSVNLSAKLQQQLKKKKIADELIEKMSAGKRLTTQELDTVHKAAEALEAPEARNLLAVLIGGGNITTTGASSGGLTAAQLEITHALVQVSTQRLTKYVTDRGARLGDLDAKLEQVISEIEKLDEEKSSSARTLSTERLKEIAEEKQKWGTRQQQIQLEREEVALNLLLSAKRLKDRLGISYNELFDSVDAEDKALAEKDKTKRTEQLDGIAREREDKIKGATPSAQDVRKALVTSSKFRETLKQLSRTNPLQTANARVAAADQMLKEIIIAMEDDLDRHFVQPMLTDLRTRLTDSGVGVGIIQRTSVLATNRLVARVDPRASAQLSVGSETDILEAAQQIAQIYLASQTAGVLGALGSLKALPRKPEGELYGLTTGNVFQVTPIFDPSGQALRFKFDHVGTSQIREPDGTVNPQLPRIERHTVNTEVQLSNMELREVSRFDSNARLGLATQYSGGFPLIKDIPYVRRVPLFGWFVRRGGSNAVTQESLIFGQTTMYPTIGDLVELLTVTPGVSQ